MVRLAVGVLCAWVCVLYSTEAMPTPIPDSVSLAAIDATPSELAVEAAQQEVNEIKHGKTPPLKTDHTLSKIDLDQMPINRIDGQLKPGQRGYLEQMIEGGSKTFKETMTDINTKLEKKQLKKRITAYEHDSVKSLAAAASKAVGDMAQEIGREADDNAEQLAAELAECITKLHSETEPDNRRALEAECAKKKTAKDQAYDEAANAISASSKAVSSAGENEGKVIAEAALNADGTSKLVTAMKDAEHAKLNLAMNEKQTAIDQNIRSKELAQKEANEATMAHFTRVYDKAVSNGQTEEDRADMAYSRPRAASRLSSTLPTHIQPVDIINQAAHHKSLTQAEEATNTAMDKARLSPTVANVEAAENAAKKIP